MSARIGGFIRCKCGKVHARHGITESSRCKCGLPLLPQTEWGKK